VTSVRPGESMRDFVSDSVRNRSLIVKRDKLARETDSLSRVTALSETASRARIYLYAPTVATEIRQ